MKIKSLGENAVTSIIDDKLLRNSINRNCIMHLLSIFLLCYVKITWFDSERSKYVSKNSADYSKYCKVK